MGAVPRSIQQFLAARRIAVAGVSRDPRQAANLIFRKLSTTGAQLFPVNPRADEVEGMRAYPNLAAIPGGVEAVLIATPPAAAADLVRECAALGISRVWMHRAIGAGSVSPEAVRLCGELGIPAIVGACPMMYVAPVDPAHRCFRTLLGWTGKLPRDPD